MVRKSKPVHQMTIAQWERAFPTEDACCAYLVGHRWPQGVACPRCGNVAVKPHGTMPYNWLCNACSPSKTNYRFSHITGTIFENTKKPLRQWFRVIHMMLTSKKGVSSLQVHRVLGFGSYETALYMCNRVRAGLADEEFKKLMGVVEVDETASPRTGTRTSVASAATAAAAGRAAQARPSWSARSSARAASSLA